MCECVCECVCVSVCVWVFDKLGATPVVDSHHPCSVNNLSTVLFLMSLVAMLQKSCLILSDHVILFFSALAKNAELCCVGGYKRQTISTTNIRTRRKYRNYFKY